MSGNPFAILSACSSAAAKADWLHREWRAWSRRAREGSYEEMMELVRSTFDVSTGRLFSESPDDWRSTEVLPEED